MAGESLLFHIDTIVINGKPYAFEDSTATIEGAARYQNTPVPSASGSDFASRRRVPTTLKMKLQFGNVIDPEALANISGAQVAGRDAQSGRRALMQNCLFGDLGAIGGGSVDFTVLVLDPIQWL